MKILSLIVLILVTFPVQALDVVLVNPTTKEEPFWALVTDLTKAAAKDLNINLKVHYASSNRQVQSQLIADISKKHQPDYLIFMPYGGSIVRSFNALEAARIPFVTLERVYDKQALSQIGAPQQVYKYWLGEMYHDNTKAGRLLAEALNNAAIKAFTNKPTLRAIGIGGDFYSESLERLDGLKQVINATSKTVLNQVVAANWSRKEATAKIIKLQQRYGNSEIIWSASDTMALGVLDAAKKLHLMPGRDFVIGGFDWLPEALRAIEYGRMTASIGGHFLQGAWALIKINDHNKGYKAFLKGDTSAHVELKVVDQSNIDKYKILMKNINYDSAVDFAEFSLQHLEQTKQPLQYRMTADAFIEKLSK